MRPRPSSRCHQRLLRSTLRIPSAGDWTVPQTPKPNHRAGQPHRPTSQGARCPHFPQALQHLSQLLLRRFPRGTHSSFDTTPGPPRLRQQLHRTASGGIRETGETPIPEARRKLLFRQHTGELLGV